MSPSVRVKVFEVDIAGNETFLRYSELRDIDGITDAERFELFDMGRVWIGGGAAPLFYLSRVDVQS